MNCANPDILYLLLGVFIAALGIPLSYIHKGVCR
jgi:hypothetical protein